ncbi:hypothetical protein LH51_01900 [Nitrincola sp. A-D6]|uniref:DUF3530 family protein n=1 Tax=Nitrincola sp. A-D6 TaxID=1545442 RepID=UPI00051F9130|nr:DUF3530 family protein [Nitrincola sp. A-D6]KGK43083.1 hypothetical protein LH51_01900 [Nitrincola sp. A-D6]
MTKSRSCIFLATLLVASLSSISSQTQAYSLRQLTDAVPADTEIVMLEQSDNSYPALLQQAERAEAHGGLLILTDTDSDTQWLEQSHAIRLHLAEHGWWTLTSQLPLTPRNNSETSAEQQEEAHTLHKEQVQQRIQQGLQTLREREQERLLILAIGRSAAQAIDYLHQNPAESDTRLIIINPRPADDQNWALLLRQLAELDITLLDLYAEPYPPGEIAIPDARMRRNAATQAGRTNYHQSRIKTPWAGWSQDMPWLTRQLRGKLLRHIIEPDQQAAEQALTTENIDQLPPGVRR